MRIGCYNYGTDNKDDTRKLKQREAEKIATQKINVVRQFVYIHGREISISTKQDDKWYTRGTLFKLSTSLPTKNLNYTLVGFTHK